jgi:hypothetical protein
MNEEIQMGGYEVKNNHLIFVKQLLRFLKLMHKKKFKSDKQLFTLFIKKYENEANVLEYSKKNDPQLEPYYQIIFENTLYQKDYSSLS